MNIIEILIRWGYLEEHRSIYVRRGAVDFAVRVAPPARKSQIHFLWGGYLAACPINKIKYVVPPYRRIKQCFAQDFFEHSLNFELT